MSSFSLVKNQFHALSFFLLIWLCQLLLQLIPSLKTTDHSGRVRGIVSAYVNNDFDLLSSGTT